MILTELTSGKTDKGSISESASVVYTSEGPEIEEDAKKAVDVSVSLPSRLS